MPDIRQTAMSALAFAQQSGQKKRIEKQEGTEKQKRKQI